MQIKAGDTVKILDKSRHHNKYGLVFYITSTGKAFVKLKEYKVAKEFLVKNLCKINFGG